MSDISNGTRSMWAEIAISALTSVCRMDAEDNETKAKDLITDLVHYLRIQCGKTFEEARVIASNAIDMAEIEMNEDEDE